MQIKLNHDWTEFLSALTARQVRFVLVGGHAVAAHGQPRMTEDLDVFVQPTLANAKRLHAALVDFGFGDVCPRPSQLARPDQVFMLGQKPWRIDILTGIDGVTFNEVWANRVSIAFSGGTLNVIGLAELLKNKRAADRPKDRADVAYLSPAETDPRVLREVEPRPPNRTQRKPSTGTKRRTKR